MITVSATFTELPAPFTATPRQPQSQPHMVSFLSILAILLLAKSHMALVQLPPTLHVHHSFLYVNSSYHLYEPSPPEDTTWLRIDQVVSMLIGRERTDPIGDQSSSAWTPTDHRRALSSQGGIDD
ncbi:hypothetical protein Pyn_31509 [Prunus yedoensis var. nudiflora]|uniref:Uncharacterized protein n=1 Tax=Prunus yedoensis var. nudiflora TaxID=2094558 RepID=A0A314U7D4_PRUYE|nr:hypothetical protein Pyn_31509 [Prunus yedoensis var. nudiflora]